MAIAGDCSRCQLDWKYLSAAQTSADPTHTETIRVADIFCGLGGLSLGAREACRRLGLGFEVALAVDSDRFALESFGENLAGARLFHGHVEGLLDGKIGAPLTRSEQGLARDTGRIDLLLGGPPCQGVSSLNNHTRMNDPRNQLYERMGRAAEVLLPDAVLIENVPGAARDSAQVVGRTIDHLNRLGYATKSLILQMAEVGVPQHRRRLIVVGIRSGNADSVIRNALTASCSHERTVRWAIEDLVEREPTGWDAPSKPSKRSRKRMEYLLRQDVFDLPNALRPPCHQGVHSYTSMYGRLKWDEPAQTITSGFGSMGQGRFVHPQIARTISPHEAARIQTIPDSYRFSPELGRTKLSELIANAVPPLANVPMVTAILMAGQAGTRASGIGKTEAA